VRSSVFCLAILLALPCAAQAEQSAPARADPAGLDLTFDPAVAAEQVAGPLAEPVGPAPQDSAEPRFSLGVDIKTRTRRDARSPATWTASAREEAPTLVDKVEGIVERSTIGVTGTYRF
jgi:hypothetical protein